MDERIKKELDMETPTEFHSLLLTHVKALVDMSRKRMSEYYTKWDTFNDIYRGFRYPDKTDLESRKKQEPEKMVVPLAFSQIQTFVSFCILLYTQRAQIVELTPQSPEDEVPAKLAEALLARDLRHSNFIGKMKQFLTDIARFSVGVLKHTWVKETEMVRASGTVEGSGMVPATGVVEKVKFQGNRIESVSPYRFFPDVRLPLARFQEGEFCASEDETTMINLKREQKDGRVAGIKNIPPWSEMALGERSKNTRLFSQEVYKEPKPGQSSGTCVVTEVQIWLVPADFMLEDGKPMGPEDYPILYVISYANDSTIIRCEPMNYVHNQFTYNLAEFNEDMHSLMNTSLSEIMDMLQSTISWFINAHISSVRRVIQNRMVIDPSGIEMEDLIQDRAYIRLNMSAVGGDVRRFIQQLQVTDVTGTHVSDAEQLHQMMMTVTGISESLLGQYSAGRRSATQDRNVNYNASSRIKVIAQLIYNSGLEPLFRNMISNLRDGLDVETYVKLKGISASPAEFQSFRATRDQLIGDYDFEVFDATLPSEKGYLAQQISDMLQAMMASPEAVPMFGYDPRKLFDKMFELRGVTNMENLRLSPEMSQQIQQQNAAQNQPPGAPGQPGNPQLGAGAPATDAQPNLSGVPMFG